MNSNFRVISRNKKLGYLTQDFNDSKFNYKYIKSIQCEQIYNNPQVIKSVLIKNFENFSISIIKYLKRKGKARLTTRVLKFEFQRDIFRLIFKGERTEKGWTVVEKSFFKRINYLKDFDCIKSQINCLESVIFLIIIKPSLT